MPERPALTYRALHQQADRTARALAAAGIGRGDRVAVALPHGPHAAAAFVTVARTAVVAPSIPPARPGNSTPSSPTWTPARSSSDRAPTPWPPPSPAPRPHPAPPRPRRRRLAGTFDLVPDPAAAPLPAPADRPHAQPAPDDDAGRAADIAFLMHTSGTTGPNEAAHENAKAFHDKCEKHRRLQRTEVKHPSEL
ncbi:AMP-binding protein, partial [Streptomyces albulus]|nr:AMP-binding protein [Streptomyces noursei]